MKSFKQLLMESESPFSKIDAACKKVGMQKYDGGWTDNSENKIKVQTAKEIIKKAGFKPTQGKQKFKTSGGFINWCFWLPKAGPYTDTTVCIASSESNGEYVRTFRLNTRVDKS